MKIKRFTAPDMRQALRMVRETLGDDAVILSNKSIEGGVELTAAVDLIAEELSAARPHGTPAAAIETVTHSRRSPAATTKPVPAVNGEALAELRNEMQSLRRWMQAELSGLSWHDLGQRAPHAQELMRRLMSLGLSADIARRLSDRVTDLPELDQAWSKAMFYLASELTISDDDPLQHAGAIALVGPTGVGKTTTIAKLAARYALRHGHRHVALVTTDNYRIGARDQLHTYGRILNVPVRSAGSPEEMETVLQSLSDRRLILIDTAGMGADSARMREQLECLQVVGAGLTTLLTLSATTDGAGLEHAVKLFQPAKPSACVLTKLDESAALGGAISALVRSGLPLSLLTDGQRVPEDLQPARAHNLIERATKLMSDNDLSFDPTYLALAYGGSQSHAQV